MIIDSIPKVIVYTPNIMIMVHRIYCPQESITTLIGSIEYLIWLLIFSQRRNLLGQIWGRKRWKKMINGTELEI